MAATDSAVINTRPVINSESTTDFQSQVKNHHAPQSVVENFILVWLDSNIKNSAADFENALDQLHCIVTSTITFADLEPCIDYIARPKFETLFMIVSDAFGPLLLPRIHQFAYVQSIFVFANAQSNDEAWITNWNKIRGLFTQIESLCESLKRDIRHCETNLTPISIISSMNAINPVANELDQSFMYSQILKEILLEMTHHNKEKEEFITFCRTQYAGKAAELKVIDEFEQFYPRPSSSEDIDEDPSPIWWYTRDCFIYSMLNKALRDQEIDIILKMGFFIFDVHQQIRQLHCAIMKREPFIVYRGQGMFNSEFEKVKNNKGGLLSFNSFLSTSIDRNVALYFANRNQAKSDTVAILFCMLIDPSSLFAPLDENTSYFQNSEKEILFSMHTVFRIGDMKEITKNVWEVELLLTRDDDGQLKVLSDYIRKEIGVGAGLDRLGSLLVKMGELDRAAEIYMRLFARTRDDDWRMLAHLNNQLGYITKQKGELSKAINLYQKALGIQLKFLLVPDLDLATTYSNIGSVHDSMGDYATALTFYQKTLDIKQKLLPADDVSLAITYNNIAVVHDSLGDYPAALLFYQKALQIQQKFLPTNHPSLATTYMNLGKLHRLMEDYSTALSFYQKTDEIFQKSLPPSHLSFASLNNNMGMVYDSMEKYNMALNFYEKSLEIKQKSLPVNHLSLGTTYNNIAFVHKSLGHYSIALSFFQKALDIARHSLPVDHQDIQDLNKQIDSMRKKA